MNDFPLSDYEMDKEDILPILTNLLQGLLSGTLSPSDIEGGAALKVLRKSMETKKKNMEQNRTAKLWLQYMTMIDLLRKFITAERLGDWDLHLQSLYDMLPYMAASGHNLYLKSIHIYLQNMSKLQQEHPEVHAHFMKGHHVVRRSDRLWAGLSTDLVIEQCLMRSLKTRGGLTRGRGMTETQRLVWVLSTPSCAEVNSAMQQFTDVQYTTSEQHIETTNARITKDQRNDANLFLQYLLVRNPFQNDGITDLRNIATGVTAPTNVNVDEAKPIGENIIKKMAGKKVVDFSFRKKDQAVNMEAKSLVKIRNEEVQIDTIILFQRLVTAGTRSEDLPDVFKHELCTYPSALFKDGTTMWPADKATLASALWSPEIESNNAPTDPPLYVLDGGALLHTIPWTRGTSWNDILDMYVQYVGRRYGQAIVVFDGYSSVPSTKDPVHTIRTGGRVGATAHFDLSMALQSGKDEFLSNKENKQRFIHMLSDKLEQVGCKAHHASGDADLLIVQTAVAAANIRQTVVIADDTDVLVLLIHHAAEVASNVWFQPTPKRNTQKMNRCWNIGATRTHLGTNVTKYILFAHAILGCDTTSRVFGIGKKNAVTKLKGDNSFLQQAEVFMTDKEDTSNVIKAGERALLSLYNGHKNETLDELRLCKFHEKTTCSTVLVEPRTLPPTSAAAKYHSLRVYLQVQVWLGKGGDMSAEKWGWKITNGKMLPLLAERMG